MKCGDCYRRRAGWGLAYSAGDWVARRTWGGTLCRGCAKREAARKNLLSRTYYTRYGQK